MYQLTQSPNTSPQWAVGDIIQFGSINGAPINWIVIRSTSSCRLLMSLAPVAFRRFGKHSTLDWKHSEVRRWLNEDFYPAAFTAEERQQIIPTRLEDDHCDFLYLLSDDERSFWSLPDSVWNCGFTWWLRSSCEVPDPDGSYTEIHYAERNGTHNFLHHQSAGKTAGVRPMVAVAPAALAHDTPPPAAANSLFDYWSCPFCGTANADDHRRCTCCGFSLRRTHQVQTGAVRTGGCSSCFSLFFPLLLIFAGLFGLVLSFVDTADLIPQAIFTLAGGVVWFICAIAGIRKNRTITKSVNKYRNSQNTFASLLNCADEESRKRAIRLNAMLLKQNATTAEDYGHAANMFALIPGYQDADAQRQDCLTLWAERSHPS